MGDQQHRPARVGRQRPDGLDHGGLALAVQVGRRLVQQDQRTVGGEQRPGQRQALALTRRQARAALAQHGLQPARQPVHEVQRVRPGQRGPHLGLGRVGPAQPDVLGDRPREEVRPLRHPGDLRAPARRVQLVQPVRGPVGRGDPYRSRRRADEAEQHREQGALARAARAGESQRLAGGEGQREPVQRGGRPAGVTGRQRVELDPGARQRGRRRGAGRRQRGLQHREDLLGRRQPLHAGVVERADLAQREVDLRRQDQHQQPGPEPHRAVHQAEADRDRDQRDRDGGEQFQREGGDEGDPQGAQGGLAVLVGDLGDGGGLRLRPVEDLERGQPLDHVQEVVREAGETAPLTVHPGLGGQPDQHHEERDQRQRRGDDRGRDPVRAEDPGQQHHRHHHREGELRQVAGEVVVQRVDPPGGVRGQLAGAPPLQVAGAERGGVVQQPPAQHRLDPGHRPMGRQLGQPGHRRPPERGGGEQQQRGGQLPEPLAALEAADHDLGDQRGLAEHQHRAGRAEQHRAGQEGPGAAGVRQEPGVDGLHVSPRRLRRGRRRGCAGRRSACGTPSTSSPGRAARSG